MFNSNVRHVLNKKHTATNKLSRRFRESLNNIDEVHEKNINDFIDDQFNCVQTCLMRVNENDDKQLLKNEYSEEF